MRNYGLTEVVNRAIIAKNRQNSLILGVLEESTQEL